MGQTARERWSALIERGPAPDPTPWRHETARWHRSPRPTRTDALAALYALAAQARHGGPHPTVARLSVALGCSRRAAAAASADLAALGLVITHTGIGTWPGPETGPLSTGNTQGASPWSRRRWRATVSA